MLKKKTAIVYFAIAVFFLADRLLKTAFNNGIWRDRAFDLLGDHLQLRFGANYLMAFSWPVSVGVISFASALIVAAMAYCAWTARRHRAFAEYAMWLIIIAGAISNLLDRLVFGYVVDYLSFVDLSVFNLADVMIAAGLVGLIIVYARNNKIK